MDSYQHDGEGELRPNSWRYPLIPQPVSSDRARQFAALMLAGICFPAIGVIFGKDGSSRTGWYPPSGRFAAGRVYVDSRNRKSDFYSLGVFEMNDTDTTTETADEVELKDEVQRETEQPHLSLQQRLGRVLSRDDTNVSSDELRGLIQECTDAIAEADGQAQYYHQQTLDIACDDPRAAKEAERECVLTRQRLLIAQSRTEEKLAKIVRRENHDRWRADRNRVAARRDEASRQFREVRDYFDDLVAIFKLAAQVDLEVQRVNASNPTGGEPLRTVECHARGIAAFSRSQPSIAATTQLPQWSDSERMLWPPKTVPLGVLVAESMGAPDPRYTDRWYEHQADRRAEQEAEAARTAKFYEDQQKAKEQREQHEAALAAEERARSGHP
jgi:hypothetical protein